jgi:hypothetical protein
MYEHPSQVHAFLLHGHVGFVEEWQIQRQLVKWYTSVHGLLLQQIPVVQKDSFELF